MNVSPSTSSSCNRPPIKPPSSCSKAISRSSGKGLAMLVQRYKESSAYRGQEYDLYQWYGDQSLSLDGAIDRAFRSEQPHSKLHGHQHLVGRKRLAELAAIARNHTDRFKNARDWNEIYAIVGDIIAQVPGAGVLAHYDIANRIGGYFRYDQTVLRVHAGAQEGAAALRLKAQKGKVALEDLPPELRSLGAMHAENFLCIYKDDLKQLNHP